MILLEIDMETVTILMDNSTDLLLSHSTCKAALAQSLHSKVLWQLVELALAQ